MATLPLQLRAAAASRSISRPLFHFHGAMNVHPLGRRGPSSAPVKLQLQARTRDSFRSHCEKRAGRPAEPEPDEPAPDPKLENHDHPDKAATPQKDYPLVEELRSSLRAELSALGVREPPDMFVKEKEQISQYERKLSSSADGRNLRESVVAQLICGYAQEALDLASKVMDIVHDGPGALEFSQHTTDQMVRTYAAILCNVADDAYHKNIGTEATLSFLGALRGLGAISHILVQDTVAKLKDGHLKNKITHLMDTHSQKFYNRMNNLEDEVARFNKEQKLQKAVVMILVYGVAYAHLYICQLTR